MNELENAALVNATQKRQMEEMSEERGLHCLCQHFLAFYRQCCDDEYAQFGEPCSTCRYALNGTEAHPSCKDLGVPWFYLVGPYIRRCGLKLNLGRVRFPPRIKSVLHNAIDSFFRLWERIFWSR